MLKSFLSLLFRSFFRNFSFSLVTLSSLIIGITTALLLFTWVKYEVSYNRSVMDSDRIYSILFHQKVDGEIHTEEETDVQLMDFLTHEVPEIEASTRIDRTQRMLGNGKKSIQKRGVYADSLFFRVYVPQQIVGNVRRPLSDTRSAVINKSVADELFPDGDAIGKSIIVDGKNEYTVSAIFTPFPDNSDSRNVNFVLPFNSRPDPSDNWNVYTVKLFDASTKEIVEKKIDKKTSQLNPDYPSPSFLFALNDWRLHWRFENGKISGGRITYLVIFAVTGVFVLVMACVNYMNISTARAAKRMREIGVRKVNGATRTTLVRQFMVESFVLTAVAALFSLILAEALLPFFNSLIGLSLELSPWDPWFALGFAGIVLFATSLAGFYPAIVLSSFQPASVLRGQVHGPAGHAGFRKMLTIFQFTLSTGMIFCSLMIWQQTDFLLKRDLGFDKHNVISVWLNDDLKSVDEAMLSRVEAHPAIQSAALGDASPIEINGYAECNRVEGAFLEPMMFYGVSVDANALTMLRFRFTQGRNFRPDLASDSSNFIVNETAAQLLGFRDPIGKRIDYGMASPHEGEIVGVVKDFQNDDIHVPIRPVVFMFGKQGNLRNLFVRYNPGKLSEAVQHLEKIYSEVQPGIPLNYSLLDGDFERQLYREKLMSRISVSITVIAVSIAALGLFGLVLFNAQRRVKEIGIRKVLGASVAQVSVMLSRDYFSPVFISFVIAFPLSYLIVQKFLQTYPSHIEASPASFLLVTTIMLILVVATAFYQSLKAALKNPVDALKTE